MKYIQQIKRRKTTSLNWISQNIQIQRHRFEPEMNTNASGVFCNHEVKCTGLLNDGLNCWVFIVSAIDEWMPVEHWWNDIGMGKPRYVYRNLYFCHFFRPQISYRLTWKWTQGCAVWEYAIDDPTCSHFVALLGKRVKNAAITLTM